MNSQPDLNLNLETAGRFISETAADGASFVVLPENFAFYGWPSERKSRSATIFKKTTQFLSEKARELGIYLLGGGFPEPVEADEKGRIYNRAELFNPEGESAAIYRKLHLFDVAVSPDTTYRESDNVKPGDQATVIADMENLGKLGLSICYDIRFPELYRKMADTGVEHIAIPSAFTLRTGMAHWETLVRTRAIENQAYVFAAAQTGKHGKKMKTFGHAMIVDPWGTVIADAGTEPGYTTAQVDRGFLEDVRKRLPALTHRIL